MKQLSSVAETYDIIIKALAMSEPFVMEQNNVVIPLKECLQDIQRDEFVVSRFDTANILMYEMESRVKRALREM
jgi:hypothetical protein